MMTEQPCIDIRSLKTQTYKFYKDKSNKIALS